VCSGAVTGLVLITPASGYVDQTAAFCMGMIGTPAVYFGMKLKTRLG
jgi:ammonia channel protein AmtB